MILSLPVLSRVILLVGCAFLAADRTVAEQLVIPSTTHADLRFISIPDPTGVAVKIPAELNFPTEKKVRYPVVVVGHSIVGWYEPIDGWFAAQLRKAEFATLAYDSFAPRQFGNVTAGNEPRTIPAVIADAYAALKVLASHPKVDPGRIAIVGFSLGGEVAHVTAFERPRAVLAPGSKFAAHVAFYPGWTYGAPAGPGAYTGAPVLLLFAEKDELTPPEKVKAYLDYLEKRGSNAPLQIINYAGAYHGWTNPRIPNPKFFPKHGSMRKCPIILIGGGRPRLLIDGAEMPFDRTLIDKCRAMSAGYTIGFNGKVRSKSLADTIEFLRKHLGP